MFAGATSFNSDLSRWQVSRLRDYQYMFSGASTFNQDLCAWRNKLERTTTFYYTFNGTACPSQYDPVPPSLGPYCAICPSGIPIQPPTKSPTPKPTSYPTMSTTTKVPNMLIPETKMPTKQPTSSPTKLPTMSPTPKSTTISPTETPTKGPVKNPTQSPTKNPTRWPSMSPTRGPSQFRQFTTNAELKSAARAANAASSGCSAPVYQTYGPIDVWDVSLIDSLDHVFNSLSGPFCTSSGQLDLNKWDVSRVTSMFCMLQYTCVSQLILVAILCLKHLLPLFSHFCKILSC